MPRSEAYVWIHLPGASKPTAAARIAVANGVGTFEYGRIYRSRPDAVAFDPVETELSGIPLRIEEDRNGGLPGVVRDAAPDAWGRYILGAHRERGPSDIELLLKSPDDRVGALSFSADPGTAPDLRHLDDFQTLDDLVRLAEAARHRREELGGEATTGGELSHRSLALAGYPPTSLGGARPKTTVYHDGRLWLAKILLPEDPFNVPRTEAAMLDLARDCGIDALKADTKTIKRGLDAILIPRFDRRIVDGEIERSRFASALTLLRADESEREAWSYPTLADLLRRHAAKGAGEELYRRMIFNALINNDDDHPRNHGILTEKGVWKLSPVYDLVPNPSHSQDVTLAMAIGSGGRLATRSNLLSRAGRFGVDEQGAADLIAQMAAIVGKSWERALDKRGVHAAQRARLAPAFVKAGLGIDAPDNPPKNAHRRNMPNKSRGKAKADGPQR